MKEFTVNANDAGQRVDKFVLKVTRGLPHSLLYKYIRTKKVKVNRKRCEPGQILKENDAVLLFLPPDFLGEKTLDLGRVAPRLTVVYEDENLIVCDKEAGLSCHSDETQQTGTLIDRIKAYLYRKGEYDPAKENSFAPALCNRIDRNTSGLVIAAKNAAALRAADEMIRERKLEKRYLAWIHGAPEKPRDTVTLYLKKDAEKNRVSVSPVPLPGHLTAITEYRTLFFDQKNDRALIEILLHTGRTHQIRATFAYLRHPLVGDSKYGSDRDDPDFSHQALRAASIVFRPDPNSPLSYLAEKRIEAPPHPLFQAKSR